MDPSRKSQKNAGPRVSTRCRGQHTLEMAIVFPLLIVLFFGVIEFGTMFYVRHSMTLAAREAARMVAVENGSATEARTVALNRLAGIGAGFTVNVTDPPAMFEGDNSVSVEITVPRSDVIIGLPGITSGGSLRTQVTMRREAEQ